MVFIATAVMIVAVPSYEPVSIFIWNHAGGETHWADIELDRSVMYFGVSRRIWKDGPAPFSSGPGRSITIERNDGRQVLGQSEPDAR